MFVAFFVFREERTSQSHAYLGPSILTCQHLFSEKLPRKRSRCGPLQSQGGGPLKVANDNSNIIEMLATFHVLNVASHQKRYPGQNLTLQMLCGWF